MYGGGALAYMLKKLMRMCWVPLYEILDTPLVNNLHPVVQTPYLLTISDGQKEKTTDESHRLIIIIIIIIVTIIIITIIIIIIMYFVRYS